MLKFQRRKRLSRESRLHEEKLQKDHDARVASAAHEKGFRAGYDQGLTDGQLLGSGVYIPGIGFLLGAQNENTLFHAGHPACGSPSGPGSVGSKTDLKA